MSENDSQRPQDAGNAGETQQQPRVQVESTPAGSNIPYVQAYDTQTGKPLGFMCIAPAMLPKIFAFPLRMTIGTDLDTADVVEEMGAEHVPCPVDDIVVDEDNKVVTTPAYMLAEDIAQAATGIEKLVARVLALSA